MKFKVILFIIPILVFFSCKKEEVIIPEAIAKETKYIIESTVIKNQWHEKWIRVSCAAGTCSEPVEIIHPSDSIPESEADYYIDTIYVEDTITVFTYDNSVNDIVIGDLLDGFLGIDQQVLFRLNTSTNKLGIVYTDGDVIVYPNYEQDCNMINERIDLNFHVDDYRFSTIYEYSGLATKIID